MMSTRLPDDLKTFLAAGRSLEYDPKQCECGAITLLRARQLRLRPFTIFTDEMQHIYGDPRRGKGCYLVPAVNLVATCQSYDPYGILIWIPKERMFGSWDCDHHVIQVLVARHVRDNRSFIEAATWTDIVQAPARYLNAQWRLDALASKVLVPWPKYRWTPRINHETIPKSFRRI
jgi:hypothetical protein